MISYNDVPVFILVGGQGSRLRSVVSHVPKPLAPIAGKPFLEWQIESLKRHGFTRVVFLTGYLFEKIEAHFGDGARFGIRCSYSREHEPLGTGGAIKKAFVDRPDVTRALVVNGDSLILMDFAAFAANADPDTTTLALHYQDDLSRFGRVVVDADFRITSFDADSADVQGGLINAGAYVMSRDFLTSIEDDAFSLEARVFASDAVRGRLKAFIATGPFIDIGVPESFALAQTVVPKWLGSEARPCLFLDRDGVLIEHVPYLHLPGDVRLIEETVQMIAYARTHGWRVVVITNQAGVGRGLFSVEQCERVHAHIDAQVAERGQTIDAWYSCYYHPTHGVGDWKRDSFERKPNPGMILKCCDHFAIDVGRSLFIGDNLTDQIALSGLETWLVQGDFDLDRSAAETRVFDSHRSARVAFAQRLSGDSTYL